MNPRTSRTSIVKARRTLVVVATDRPVRVVAVRIAVDAAVAAAVMVVAEVDAGVVDAAAGMADAAATVVEAGTVAVAEEDTSHILARIFRNELEEQRVAAIAAAFFVAPRNVSKFFLALGLKVEDGSVPARTGSAVG